MQLYTDLFIDGDWRPADSSQYLETLNPATGESLAKVACGGPADINAAIVAARRAFEGEWATLDPTPRAQLLRRIAQLIHKNGDELALLDTRDGGRPIRDTPNDVNRAADLFHYYAGTIDKIRGATLPVPKGYLAYTRWEPYGVVGAITPWNVPLAMAALKVAPALATGNCVILKPSELTPLSALRLASLCKEAGLPAGVLNVVPGQGEIAGAALVAHPDVDKIAFTGSTAIGSDIMRAAAENITPVTLELGGKAPNIVFDDANLDAAARGALFSCFHHQGQICAAGTRLLVQQSIAGEFHEILLSKLKKVRVGHPEDPAVHVGAMISPAQFERVHGYVRRGIEEGATVLTGGEPLVDDVPAGGRYYKPTIFSDVQSAMTIAQEEIFGPVLSILTFKDEEEAIRLGNDVIYGLFAAVWTKDIGRAHRVSMQLNAGTVWINMINVMNVSVPSGGFRQSGIGKEYGLEGAESYMRMKTVWTNAGERAVGWDL